MEEGKPNPDNGREPSFAEAFVFDGVLGRHTMMHHGADGRKRFELLLQQAELPAEWVAEHFADGYINKVEISRSRKEWKFYFVKSKPLPASIYVGLIERIKSKLGHLADISVHLAYEDTVPTAALLQEYWPVFVEWMQHEFASVNGWLAKSRFEVENEILTLILLDETGLGLARRKTVDVQAARFFEERFGRACRVQMIVGESRQEAYEVFAQKIRQESREAIQQLMESSREEEPPGDSPTTLQHGYEIKDQPVPIQQVLEEEKKVTVQGAVFALDVKELRSGSTLYQFHVTDYTDSPDGEDIRQKQRRQQDAGLAG
jgi:DNA polymerase-3 subunit alpha (Gram-positive type)